MRILPLGLILLACDTPPAPAEPHPAEPHPAATQPADLVIPVGHAANLPLQMYVGIDGVWDTEVDYALGDGYPASLTITPPNEIYVIQGCSTPRGTTAWTTLANVQGTAATLSLRSGVLSVSLNTEGTVTAVLEGEATGISCNGVTTLPLHHTLTIRVRRITGFVVDQVHQRWPGCEAGVVLPEGVALWLPVAHPLDASGNRFEAANAPKPVAMTLKSTGELARTMQSWELTASAGHVDLSLDTTRPVRGLASFEVVGAEALTRVEAKLFLRKAAWKGYVSEEITEGASYQLWFPEQDNLVDLQVTSALSSAGKLCMPIPGRWLTATSSTPHCGPAGGEQYGGGLPVAEIQSLGECRLEVTMPNTSHRWAASFTTR